MFASNVCVLLTFSRKGAFHALRPEDLRCGVSIRGGMGIAKTILSGVLKCKSRRMVLPIFASLVYANLQSWCTPEKLLQQLRREIYTECTLVPTTIDAQFKTM